MQDILVSDIDKDGHYEIITGGNTNASSIQEGWYDADKGSFMVSSENDYRIIENYKTGLFIKGEVRSIQNIDFLGSTYLLIARNNSSPQMFKVIKY